MVLTRSMQKGIAKMTQHTFNRRIRIADCSILQISQERVEYAWCGIRQRVGVGSGHCHG